MKTNNFLILLLIVIVTISCSTTRVWTDKIESADLSLYSSYEIDDQCSSYNPGVNPINQIRAKNAIELKLQELGFVRAENADINVVFIIKNETKYFYDNCVPNYNHFTGGMECLQRIHAYDEGTLVVDLIDTKTNSAFWHGGAGSKAWQLHRDPQKKINEMVSAIFEEFGYRSPVKDYAKNL